MNKVELKKVVLILFLLLFNSVLFAQESDSSLVEEEGIRNIFGDNSDANGGYGAFTIRYTRLANIDAFIHGGRGGWVINHDFTFGFEACGFDSEPRYDGYLGYDCRLTGGYAGVFLEGIIFRHSPVHVTIPLFVGGGGVAYRKHYKNIQEINNWHAEDSEPFLIEEIGIELELNILKHLRMDFGTYYRNTSKIDLNYNRKHDMVEGVSGNFMKGITFGVTFKVGKF